MKHEDAIGFIRSCLKRLMPDKSQFGITDLNKNEKGDYVGLVVYSGGDGLLMRGFKINLISEKITQEYNSAVPALCKAHELISYGRSIS